jgi:hypothetical protein
MAIAVCVNPECEEYDVPKELAFPISAGEVIRCGGWVGQGDDRAPCAQPCDVRERE